MEPLKVYLAALLDRHGQGYCKTLVCSLLDCVSETAKPQSKVRLANGNDFQLEELQGCGLPGLHRSSEKSIQHYQLPLSFKAPKPSWERKQGAAPDRVWQQDAVPRFQPAALRSHRVCHSMALTLRDVASFTLGMGRTMTFIETARELGEGASGDLLRRHAFRGGGVGWWDAVNMARDDL